MARTTRAVTLREAAEAIVTHCYDRRHWHRDDHIDFAERQLLAAERRGYRKALADAVRDNDEETP